MYVDMVFQGGGILGISYIGVLRALDEKGYKIKRCAGTSAGSIVAALVAAGYNWHELYEIAKHTDFNKFMKKTRLSKFLTAGKILSIIVNKGIYDSKVIEDWMRNVVGFKGITDFKDIMKEGESSLKIISADITKRELMIIPDTLQEYGMKSSEFSIAKAIRMSCSIPFFYTPFMLKYQAQKSYIVDGGLLSNFPVWVFDVEGIPRWPTFGVKIKKKDSYTAKGKNGILDYVMDVVNASLNYNQAAFIREKDRIRMIEIEFDKDISSTDFKRTEDNIEYLYNTGYECARKFFDSWDFNNYIKKYRIDANSIKSIDHKHITVYI